MGEMLQSQFRRPADISGRERTSAVVPAGDRTPITGLAVPGMSPSNRDMSSAELNQCDICPSVK